jgi:hypothetical protein
MLSDADAPDVLAVLFDVPSYQRMDAQHFFRFVIDH